jgi:hypothetical protein
LQPQLGRAAACFRFPQHGSSIALVEEDIDQQ